MRSKIKIILNAIVKIIQYILWFIRFMLVIGMQYVACKLIFYKIEGLGFLIFIFAAFHFCSLGTELFNEINSIKRGGFFYEK